MGVQEDCGLGSPRDSGYFAPALQGLTLTSLMRMANDAQGGWEVPCGVMGLAAKSKALHWIAVWRFYLPASLRAHARVRACV